MDSFMRIVGDADARWWSKVEKTESCWNWLGHMNPQGYGRFDGRDGRSSLAHRWGYQRFVGSVADDLELDHLCRNTRCVRFDHLEPVTTAENARRRVLYKTHCKQGHEFTPENTAIVQGCRRCRQCSRDVYHRSKARKGDAA
jgi:hypothetical protein